MEHLPKRSGRPHIFLRDEYDKIRLTVLVQANRLMVTCTSSEEMHLKTVGEVEMPSEDAGNHCRKRLPESNLHPLGSQSQEFL